MRILYTGELNTSYLSTCTMRMEVLQGLGHEVEGVDLVQYIRQGGPFFGRLFRRFKVGPPIQKYNKELVETANRMKPDVLWIDKGSWVFPSTVKHLQSKGAKVILYTPDSAFFHNQSRWFNDNIPLFDGLVTTKLYEVEEYNRRKAANLIVKPPMYFKEYHYPVEPTAEEKARFECDAAFVGTFTEGRDKYLLPLLDAGVELKIWGNFWDRCKDPRLQQCVQGRGVFGRDYILGISCGRLSLGILNPLVPDTSTTRTVEIPATRGLLFAERTDEHRDMYEEDKEAVFFNSVDECVEKALHYLNHPEERAAVVEAGFQRTLNSHYDAGSQIKDVLAEVVG